MKKSAECRILSQSVAGELTPPQLKAVAALVYCASIEEAASEAGVSRSSVHRWLRDDDAFARELRKARAVMFDEALAELQDTTREGVRVLRELLKSRHEGIRLRAAGLALAASMRAREVIELSERVRKLEDIIGGGLQ